MNTEIVRHEPGELVQINEAGSFLKMIADAVRDPAVNVEKVERLMALKERFDQRQAEIAFSEAMARLQPTLPRITKHGRIEVSGTLRSSYAKLEDIDLVIRPLYSAEGFSISWNTQTSDKGTKITGRLRHVAGHSEAYEIILPIDTSGSKNSVQGMGSTFSYGKRYLLSGMFNLITIDQDDDGNGGSTDPINETQVNQIRDLIIHTNSNEKKFLIFVGAVSVETIMQRDFKRAISALRERSERTARS